MKIEIFRFVTLPRVHFKITEISTFPLLLAIYFLSCSPTIFGWEAVKGKIMTEWSGSISPDKVLPEYPRPQLERDEWLNLNGLWEYAITESSQTGIPSKYDGKILVPFCIESALSGVMKPLNPHQTLWYRRKFNIPKEWKNKRILLHFGAVDWETAVYINGKVIGIHKGGYDGFSFDITDFLREQTAQEIVVAVKDYTDSSWQLRGKQSLRPAGCNYTACSGIWQTVWIEPVASSYIECIQLVPDINKNELRLTVNARILPKPTIIEISAFSNSVKTASTTNIIGKELTKSVLDNLVNFYKATSMFVTDEYILKIQNPQLWTPDDPFLYDLVIVLKDDQGKICDTVKSYFGMREIKLRRDEKGFARVYLNGKLLVMPGALDQGYWPDGIYTAPTDEALRFDIETAKRLGLVALRKHVKVEPQRWYYWADRLGLLVLQDMPTGNEGDARTDRPRSPEAADQCLLEKTKLIQQLFNHPSIICWILFNEGWGQHNTLEYVKIVRKIDPTRLIDEASGFPWHGGGDVADHHGGLSPAEPNRIGITSEDGGFGLSCPNNQWSDKPWTYRTFDPKTGEEIDGFKLKLITTLTDQTKQFFTRRIARLFRSLWTNSERIGMSGLFYCQLYDVEDECNGLLSYDRKIWKVFPEQVAFAAKGNEIKTISFIFPKSETEPVQWRYTINQPQENWFSADYDDSNWKVAPAPFGNDLKGINTRWTSSNIWLRMEFNLDKKLINPRLRIFHDEDVEVYINGILAFKESGFLTGWDYVDISPEAAKSLKIGKNIIAAHCVQTSGAQFIDIQLVDFGRNINPDNNSSAPTNRASLLNYSNPLPFSYAEGQSQPRKEIRDPCILRDGEKYYLVFTMYPFRGRDEKFFTEPDNGSSPGIALYSTTNFGSWQFENWLVKSSDLPENSPYKHRFWAPEIHKIKGKYYLIFTADNWLKKENNPAGSWGAAGYAFIGVADSINGSYRNITYINGAACDTSLFEDSDGKTYAIIPRYNIDIQEIDLTRINKGIVELVGKPKTIVYDKNRDAGIEADPDYLEGPWLEKINGKYWLFYAATHRDKNYPDWLGYWTCAAVAENVLGPYKKIPGVRIFEGGHLSVFQTPDKVYWFCFRGEEHNSAHGLLCITPFYTDNLSPKIKLKNNFY
jgi:hypothetical protein